MNIEQLMKQNNAIHASLVSKQIEFTRTKINQDLSQEEQLTLVIEENKQLKELSKQNKPSQIKKEVIQSTQPIQTVNKKVENKQNNDDSDSEKETKEPKNEIKTITNMEEIKRAFFNGNYEEFETLVKVHPFHYYIAVYKYNDELVGIPEFIAKNRGKGFIGQMEDNRKCIMACVRCFKNDNNYDYQMMWIVNTNEPINNISEIVENFDFVQESDINKFLSHIRKIDKENMRNCIFESYVH